MVGGIIVGVGRWIETMRQEVKQGYTMLAVLLVTLMLLGGVVPLLVGAAGSTSVRVSPTSQTVSAGQTFIVTVSCTPGQLIKSFECKVLFNSSLLQANSVTEGNIFHGYSTFFKNGTINNSAGTIIDVYGLILGTGSVSTSGTFISISFTARSASGTSTVGLSGVGVTNETNYVPITVTNGSVILREFTLGVALDGSGSVTQNPNLATYPYGTVVQLTATASSGWVFGSWTGDLSGTQNPKTITMTGNKSVTAHFTQAQYTLLITIQGSGTVTKVPDQASYTYGQVVQLTASPASGWMFNHWAGDLTGSTTPASVTMNGNRAVTANFTITSGYTLAITIQGSGTVTKVPDLTSYTYGQVVTLTANPSTGWVFNHWGGDLTGSASPTTITMNGNRAVTVNFTAIHYTLSLTIQGSGTVTRAPDQSWYTYGQVVQLTASPAAGWVFNHWAGDLTGSTTPASVTMNGNRAVTANFTITSGYTLAITVQGSGTVTKNPNRASYVYGEVVTLTAVPSTGWMFSSWTGDLTGSQNPKTITMNGNKAVAASFSDSAPSQISGVSRTSSTPLDVDPLYGWVNVSCTVTDNVGVSQVILKIHTPGGSWNNVSMLTHTTSKYYYRSTTAFSAAGNYSYSIWAKDTSNNTNSSSSVLFSMPPNWDINNDGICNILDLVNISNHYSESGPLGWIREDADNNGEVQVIDLVNVSNHLDESWW